MSEQIDRLADDLRAAFNSATDYPNTSDFPTLADMPEYPRERWRAVARRAIELGAAVSGTGRAEQ